MQSGGAWEPWRLRVLAVAREQVPRPQEGGDRSRQRNRAERRTSYGLELRAAGGMEPGHGARGAEGRGAGTVAIAIAAAIGRGPK
eukprot:COSAG01_NODE_48480_length_381_cov_0.475177_1_plen_85_part_00